MRIVQKFAGSKERKASQVFIDCLKNFPNKTFLPDSIEFRISEVDALIIEKEKAIISVSRLSVAEDEKFLRSIFSEYLNRIFVKELLVVPQLIEDVIVYKETAKILGDDYLYYVYQKIAGKKPKDFQEYLGISAYRVAFSFDDAAAEMLYQLCNDKRYEARAKSLFTALKKNLWLSSNLERALTKLRRLDAGNKV